MPGKPLGGATGLDEAEGASRKRRCYFKSGNVRGRGQRVEGLGLVQREGFHGKEAEGDKPHLDRRVGPMTHW